MSLPTIHAISKHTPPLTTRQRDILHTLLHADAPIATAEIGSRLDVTTRQVNYSMKGLQRWLGLYGAVLSVTPGVGVTLQCDEATLNILLVDVTENEGLQLLLTAEQRRQILAFVLLNATEHHILDDFQRTVDVSRTTVLKDLDEVGQWLRPFGLTIERKSNYGTWLSGTEQAKRFALTALYAGDTPFAEPLWQLSFINGLQFRFAADTHLLPILNEITQVTARHDVRLGMEQIARAEARLGMAFSDQAVLHIALMLAIQAERAVGHHLTSATTSAVDEKRLRKRPIWAVAKEIASALEIKRDRSAEIVSIARALLSGTKVARWQGDIDFDPRFAPLIDTLLDQISAAYECTMSDDGTLRDGLIAHLIPACLRVQFGVYLPDEEQMPLSAEKYTFEYQVADEIVDTVNETLTISLPNTIHTALAMLLRAAYIRTRPNALPHVVVVCPSGMATAQLLVARLKVRFAQLGQLRVVSVRDLLSSSAINDCDLVITTVPLPDLQTAVPIIQVHPHLSVDDVTQITEWLAS